jgi:hypothetical protein
VSWVNEDGTHEGWTAPLFADGAIGSGWLISPQRAGRTSWSFARPTVLVGVR